LSYLRFCTVKIHEGPKPKIFKLQGRNPKKIFYRGVKPEMTDFTEGKILLTQKKKRWRWRQRL